jgi:predicted GIY-YIG superfamily endonuclease
MFYTYIIQDKINFNIYIGYSGDLRRRMKEHLKRNPNWVLVYYEAYLSEKDARQREQKLKYYGTSLSNLKRRMKYSFLEQ